VHRTASRLDFSPKKATTLGPQASGALLLSANPFTILAPFVDVCATVSEATIVIAIGALLLRGTIKQSAALIAPILAGALMLIAHLPHLLLLIWLL
jgi:hypothetical protein